MRSLLPCPPFPAVRGQIWEMGEGGEHGQTGGGGYLHAREIRALHLHGLAGTKPKGGRRRELEGMSCESLSGLLSCPRILLQLAAVGMFFSYLPSAPGLCHTPSSTTGLSFLVSQAYFNTCMQKHHWHLIIDTPK